MLGSIAGAFAAVLMIPTSLSAQGVGGAVNAGAAVRGAVVQGIPTLEIRSGGREPGALRSDGQSRVGKSEHARVITRALMLRDSRPAASKG
jgi:hypothetical protein